MPLSRRTRTSLIGLLLGAVFGLLLGAAVAAALLFSGSVVAARYASASLVGWFTVLCAAVGALHALWLRT